MALAPFGGLALWRDHRKETPMIHHIELGGKTRPVLFGTAAFREAKQQSGLTVGAILLALDESDFTVIADVTYYALKIGAYAQKQEVEAFTATDVAIWMDTSEGAMKQLLEWLTEAMRSISGIGEEEPQETPGEAKKKRKTSTGLQ